MQLIALALRLQPLIALVPWVVAVTLLVALLCWCADRTNGAVARLDARDKHWAKEVDDLKARHDAQLLLIVGNSRDVEKLANEAEERALSHGLRATRTETAFGEMLSSFERAEEARFLRIEASVGNLSAAVDGLEAAAGKVEAFMTGASEASGRIAFDLGSTADEFRDAENAFRAASVGLRSLGFRRPEPDVDFDDEPENDVPRGRLVDDDGYPV
jgi:hypothetical protein